MSLIDFVIDSLPVNKGDVILFSSDIRKLLFNFLRNNENLDINLFLDKLVNKVGDTGTLLLPTYNWDFCGGNAFSYNDSPSKTGSLSQVALKHSKFKRTKHPLYSFAVAGKDQDYLCSLENRDSFGADSPFAYLYHHQAKNILFDVNMQDSFTFMHFVEETVGVKYRFVKNFKSNYIDENEDMSERTYSMYVRDYDLNSEVNLFPMEEYMKEEKIITEHKVANLSVLEIPLIGAFKYIKYDIINNNSKKIAVFKGQ